MRHGRFVYSDLKFELSRAGIDGTVLAVIVGDGTFGNRRIQTSETSLWKKAVLTSPQSKSASPRGRHPLG